MDFTLHVRTGHGAQNMIEDPLGVPNVLVRVSQELVLRSKDAFVMLFPGFTGQLVIFSFLCSQFLSHQDEASFLSPSFVVFTFYKVICM